LIAAASQVLGPDLMVWSAGLFIKDANTAKIVSWHQDLTYWGLDDAEETTCWVALSPASTESGCMKFIPGSHKKQLVAHVDTFDENNLLTRGQEIAVEVNEEDGVAAALNTGQASMHHGHLFHASGPNTTADRRIGSAIRYIKPSMKQQSGDKSLVALVSGEDKYGHFEIAETPRGRLLDEDFERCFRDLEIKRRVLYDGADETSTSGAGKLY
jgi:ectoine hydroxylase-related dioxygenase (phytanoyl-CoA dioxygenase family)